MLNAEELYNTEFDADTPNGYDPDAVYDLVGAIAKGVECGTADQWIIRRLWNDVKNMPSHKRGCNPIKVDTWVESILPALPERIERPDVKAGDWVRGTTLRTVWFKPSYDTNQVDALLDEAANMVDENRLDQAFLESQWHNLTQRRFTSGYLKEDVDSLIQRILTYQS